MVGAVSMLSVAAGALVAYVSERIPARTEALETVAGIILLGGFAAIGCALPSIL
jgi:hypothetical protein